MKRIAVLITLITVSTTGLFAQFMETGMAPAYSDGEQFTEWKKVEFTIDNQNYSYEYRAGFIKRKALACSYEIQLKNTSSEKLSIKMKTHYYDKLVEGNFGDEYKETVKPGAEVTFIVLTQGCQADKNQKDLPDHERCQACGMTYEIYAEVD
jgi:hypothetical protein